MIQPKRFQKLILDWFDKAGRKNLPWQQQKTAYRVWVSEIMLQQTQVNTVIPYYQRFLQRFPTIDSLANAHEDEVLHLWTGLGYYNRARNLQKTAQRIVKDFNGEFPNEISVIQTLPGIGRSTAGAILSLAFNKAAPILDGNVKRVLTRFRAITGWSGDKKVLEELWQLAEKFTPTQRVADYTQAMMDLGATLCTRSEPRCASCPLVKDCESYKKNLQQQIPAAKPKKSIPQKKKTFLILHHEGKILLEKRPASGVWAKLWSLPEMDLTTCHETIKKHCHHKFRFKAKSTTDLTAFRHTFSHFQLDIHPVLVELSSVTSKCMENNQQIWYNLASPQAVGLPQPIKKILEAL